MSAIYPMLPLDIRALIRNQFKISKPCSKTYTFKKRISPIVGGGKKGHFVNTAVFRIFIKNP